MASTKLRSIPGWHKQTEVVKRLTRLARRLGPGAQLPQFNEIATALGVTKVTLDHALRQLENKGFIARQRRKGIFVSPGIQQKRLGLVLAPDISTGGYPAIFFLQLLQHCKVRADTYRERFSLFFDAPDSTGTSATSLIHADLVEAAESGKLDGIIVAAHGDVHLSWLQRHKLPFVYLGADPAPGVVVLDAKALIRMSAETLIKRGCSDLAIFGVNADEERYFRQLQSKLSFRAEDEWIKCVQGVQVGESLEPYGHSFAEQLLALRKNRRSSFPQGLIITNDIMARKACAAIQEAGLKIGRDLIIVSHANKNSIVLESWEKILIRCEYDVAEIARALFQLLHDQINGTSNRPKSVSVQPRIIFPSPPLKG